MYDELSKKPLTQKQSYSSSSLEKEGLPMNWFCRSCVEWHDDSVEIDMQFSS